MDNKYCVLVIGAGASGLVSIKSCKEGNLDVVCYEKTKNFGGRWRYAESPAGVASVMRSTVCNSSKELEAFSDFPAPSEYPNHMHHSKMISYLTMYAEKFDLLQHIAYQREIVQVTPSPQYKQNGRWLVTIINHSNRSQMTEEFAGVLVCTGRLSQPRIPFFPHQDKFEGVLMHSQSVKNVSAFENLKVLVVGSGNSAVDVAVEISTVAEQVYLSTKSGFWLFPKVGPKGLPFDSFILRRNVNLLKNFCSPVVNYYIEKYLQTKMDHELFRIKPNYRPMDKIPTINDDLPDKILTGRIIVKSAISRFEKHGVVFEHEDELIELDGVIFATGYDMNPFFLEKNVYRDSNCSLKLYKRVFPADRHHPTLGFIGFVDSFGPHIPISELQSRWAARLLSKKIHLPPVEVMQSHIVTYSNGKENRNKLVEDYISYMDGLAEEIGVKPNKSLLFKDMSLFCAIFMGPFLPYQYRLIGPHSSNNARNFILEYDKRAIYRKITSK